LKIFPDEWASFCWSRETWTERSVLADHNRNVIAGYLRDVEILGPSEFSATPCMFPGVPPLKCDDEHRINHVIVIT
jgi:hypothetical protein